MNLYSLCENCQEPKWIPDKTMSPICYFCENEQLSGYASHAIEDECSFCLCYMGSCPRKVCICGKPWNSNYHTMSFWQCMDASVITHKIANH